MKGLAPIHEVMIYSLRHAESISAIHGPLKPKKKVDFACRGGTVWFKASCKAFGNGPVDKGSLKKKKPECLATFNITAS